MHLIQSNAFDFIRSMHACEATSNFSTLPTKWHEKSLDQIDFSAIEQLILCFCPFSILQKKAREKLNREIKTATCEWHKQKIDSTHFKMWFIYVFFRFCCLIEIQNRGKREKKTDWINCPLQNLATNESFDSIFEQFYRTRAHTDSSSTYFQETQLKMSNIKLHKNNLWLFEVFCDYYFHPLPLLSRSLGSRRRQTVN